jgi:hypothetical protein
MEANKQDKCDTRTHAGQGNGATGVHRAFSYAYLAGSVHTGIVTHISKFSTKVFVFLFAPCRTRKDDQITSSKKSRHGIRSQLSKKLWIHGIREALHSTIHAKNSNNQSTQKTQTMGGHDMQYHVQYLSNKVELKDP